MIITSQTLASRTARRTVHAKCADIPKITKMGYDHECNLQMLTLSVTFDGREYRLELDRNEVFALKRSINDSTYKKGELELVK